MSKAVIVRYTTRPEAADENARLVEAVYEELNAHDPGGLHYVTLRLDDGVSFVHVAIIDGDDNPLSRAAAFAEFTAGVAERCVEGPTPSNGTVVGSYGLTSD